VNEEPIGAVLAGYRLEELIGQGGMSAVYRAEHVHLGKKVALKILSPALAMDQDFRERFLRESRIAASIEHPNIIPIYDAGEVEGRLYIAMRYVDGLDLKQLIERDGPLSLGRTLFFIEQIASALDAAHALDLVHRDVKPGNVLVVGGTERVYLSDFGVVKHSGSTGLTRTGYFLGTIDYAAPELIEGRPVDARTDVYAVGCLVYECLTGAPPFQRAGEMAVIHAHLTEDPPRPSLKRPDLPGTIDGVIATAMAKEQAQRYPSAGALAQAMRAVALDIVPDAAGLEAERPPTYETVISTSASVPEDLPMTPPPAAASNDMPARPPGDTAMLPDQPRSRRGGSFRTGTAAARRRLGKKGILIAAGVVVAAAAAAVFAVRSSGGSHSQTAPSDSAMTAGGYPDAIEQDLLLAHIPTEIRSTCRRIPPLATAVFIRSLRCAQGPGGRGFVTYSRAHSGDALRAYFLQQVQNAGLRYPTAAACRTGHAAADEWRRQGLATHVEGPTHLAEGRVVCGREGSTASISWTDTPTKIFAQASRPAAQSNSLYVWWGTAAGPQKDLQMSGEEMGPAKGRYPDAIEQELLLHHVPPAIRTMCVRSNAFDHTVFLRAITCSVRNPSVSVEYMYAHNGTALKTYSDNQITAAGLNFPTSQECAGADAAADTWIRRDDIGHVERHFTRQAEGRVLCYVAGGQAVIEWTDSTTGIYAHASGESGARRALYDWWKGNAGPGALEMGAMKSGSMP
jgi:serine/threonine protein kinase